MSSVPAALPQARHQFLELVAEVRPELHRYCARLTGSIVDGEDVVQDVLAKAFYQLSQFTELPPLRPWLFRAAHNAAIDFCRRYERAHVEPWSEALDNTAAVDTVSPEVVRAALSAFLALPIRQRSAVILKDVLGFSLEEIAGTLDTSVLAVKSALVRGRERLRAQASEPTLHAPDAAGFREELALLHRYASLFNARDWDGLRGLLDEEVRLDLVSQAARAGKQVGQYFERYAKETDLRMVPGLLEGRAALAVYAPASAAAPKYFVLIDWNGDRARFIRDFKYVPYIGEEAPHLFWALDRLSN